MKLGWAAGKVFAKEGRSKILIGKDTRISGYMFESALESGLIAAGVDVSLFGLFPLQALPILRAPSVPKLGLSSAPRTTFITITALSFSGLGENCLMTLSLKSSLGWTSP